MNRLKPATLGLPTLALLSLYGLPAAAQESAPQPNAQSEQAEPAGAQENAPQPGDAAAGQETAGQDRATEQDRAAQQNSAPAQSELDELRATINALQDRVAELEAKEKSKEESEAVEPGNEAAKDANQAEQTAAAEEKGAPPSDQDSTIRHRKTFREDHGATPRPGNAASDQHLKGFFALGDTGVWLKLGGYAKLDAIVDSAIVGNPNKFATSSIYTQNQAEYDRGPRFNLHAKQSRLNFEARTDTVLGSLRVVYENDFYGDGLSPNMAYNLRHLYGQVANLTIGQTWTLYIDADAIPDTLDFAGPGVQAIRRVPQIRYTIPFSTAAHLAFAAEQPGGDLTGVPAGGTARNVAPDITMAFRLEDQELGHAHLGAAVRVLGYDDANDVFHAGVGWTTNFSGILNTFKQDHLTLNLTVGQGTGHYAQDLGSGNAAVINASGDVRALLTWGGFIGYRHFWSDQLTSQATYGYLELEERAELAPTGYRRTHYAQGNLIYSPSARFHMGVEYLYGYRRAQDDSHGVDHRAQASFKFNLF